MVQKCRVIGYILEQNGRILVECKDEYGHLSPSNCTLPFVFSASDVSDKELVRKEVEKQFLGAKIDEFAPIFSTSFRTDSTSAAFYYVKLDKAVEIDDDFCKRWVSPDIVLKESFGISLDVIDAYLKSKIQILY